MSLYNIASDIQTRECVWIPSNVSTGKQFTLDNQVRSFAAYEIAGAATNYKGPQDRQ